MSRTTDRKYSRHKPTEDVVSKVARRAPDISPATAPRRACPCGGGCPRCAVQGYGGVSHKERDVHSIAASGLSGHAAPLPHLARLQSSFGRHDLSSIRSYIGGSAAKAAHAMGARAYTFGDAIAFSEPPNLDTAAHEAAHVVQQRAGVNVPGNIGQTGDLYERHADSVAYTVVQGRSAETLLDPYVPIANTAPLKKVVQRDGEDNFAGTGLPWRLGPFDVEPTHLGVFKQNVIDRIVNRLAPRRPDP